MKTTVWKKEIMNRNNEDKSMEKRNNEYQSN